MEASSHPPDQLALELVRRSLDRQATVLGELRTRTGVVLAATAIVVSLFGPPAVKGGVEGKDWLPLGAFMLGMLACVRVLWPVRLYARRRGPKRWRQGWRLDVDVARLIRDRENYEATAAPPGASLSLRVASDLEVARSDNERILNRISYWFVAACVLLLAQVSLWALTAG